MLVVGHPHCRRETSTSPRIHRDGERLRVLSDIPHTFIIDEYRIAKRAAIGQTITFEFRADRVGTFRIYCNLTTDDRCKRMKGELVVTP